MPQPELDRTATIARDLIRFDTSNYGEGRSNGEAEAAAYMGALLERLDLEPRYFEPEPGRTSVVARVEGSDRSAPALVVHGHLDVVPADPEMWSVDPFGGEVRDGMLWGRGAVDMKNMDAMIITALEDLLGSGRRPRRDLIVAFLADEEAGGVLGSHWLVQNHPEVFQGASEAISEVGGYSVTVNGTRAYLLQTGEKALVWIKLIARGAAAHGSRIVDDNVVTRLAEAVVKLGTHEWPTQLTATTERLVDELARLLGVQDAGLSPDEVVVASGNAAGFIRGTLRVTSNPTVLSAGYKHNVIPETAEALIDVRTLPGEEDRVLAELQRIVGDDIEIVVMHRDVGLENPFSGDLVSRMVETLNAHDPGAPVLPYLLSGGTDNKALSELGIRGYGFAPLRLPADMDFASMFHGIDERVPLDSLTFGRRVLVDLLSSC